MDRSKALTWVAILVAVVMLGLGIGWLATRSTPLPPVRNQAPAPRSEPSQVRSAERSPTAPGSSAPRAHPSPPRVVQSSPEPVAPEIPASTNATNAWEDQLEEILASEDEDTNKVQQLFAMFPGLPPEGQDEVVRHLSNLVEDENYAPLGRLAVNPELPEEVLDTLLADLLNRPNATKLPAFLEIAFTPNHSKAAEAKELLELYLEDDFGPEKAVWQRKMEEWLKENPD